MIKGEMKEIKSELGFSVFYGHIEIDGVKHFITLSPSNYDDYTSTYVIKEWFKKEVQNGKENDT